MRKAIHFTALAALAFGTAMSSAFATDLPPEPPIIIEEPPLIVPEAVAIEDSGFYLRADAGISQFAKGACIGKEEAFTGDVGVGYRYNVNLRVDVTVAYSGKYKPACQSIETWTTMLNGYYDIPTGTVVTPYLGAGIGWLHVKSSTGFKDDAVGVSAMAGISVRASEKVDVDLGYRYTYAAITGDPNWGDHAIRVGLRMSMN